MTTDAPQPPSLSILSPTPRSFTFPAAHNLADSPSPSSSPFEPDHHSFPVQSCTLVPDLPLSIATPPPPLAHLRPDSPSPSSPVAPPTHKRRKSSCGSDVVERRPKKGDEDYIKRPENAFILFRRKCCEDRQAEEEAAKADGAKKPRQADLSKTISQMWKSLPADERQIWEQMAKDKKKEHAQLYPNYVYRPQRSKDKDGKAKGNKKSSLKRLDESDSLSFVVPVARPHGRSASVPTPPPYQSIQIPNVYHLTPSCPTSPSLLPMISRRSAHPGHPEDIMANFDYLPTNNSFAPPAFPMSGQFEASLQVNIRASYLVCYSNISFCSRLTSSEISSARISMSPERASRACIILPLVRQTLFFPLTRSFLRPPLSILAPLVLRRHLPVLIPQRLLFCLQRTSPNSRPAVEMPLLMPKLKLRSNFSSRCKCSKSSPTSAGIARQYGVRSHPSCSKMTSISMRSPRSNSECPNTSKTSIFRCLLILDSSLDMTSPSTAMKTKLSILVLLGLRK